MNTLQKTELVNELLPIVNELKREQRKAGAVLAVLDVTREQLEKFSLSELQQLKREIENLQKVKDLELRFKNYDKQINSKSEDKGFKIMC